MTFKARFVQVLQVGIIMLYVMQMELKPILRIIVLNGKSLRKDSLIELDDNIINLKFMYYEKLFF